ncbi:MAG: hypothetical protein Q8882_08815, partial [Bacillota bacterium]|nr:hypothetical protein [Bacillota bacterium]
MRKKLPATLVLTLILTLCLSISSSAFAAVGIIQSEDSEKVNIDITFYNNGDTSITARPIPVLYTESGQIAGICPGSLTTLNPGDSITQQYSIVLREKMVYKT